MQDRRAHPADASVSRNGVARPRCARRRIAPDAGRRARHRAERRPRRPFRARDTHGRGVDLRARGELTITCAARAYAARIICAKADYDLDIAPLSPISLLKSSSETRKTGLPLRAVRHAYQKRRSDACGQPPARAASGHATAAPPRSVMNWRRLMSDMGLPRAIGDH